MPEEITVEELAAAVVAHGEAVFAVNEGLALVLAYCGRLTETQELQARQIGEIDRILEKLTQGFEVLTPLVEQQRDRQEAQARLLEEITSDVRLWRAQRMPRR
jgi:hypothetical protein